METPHIVISKESGCKSPSNIKSKYDRDISADYVMSSYKTSLKNSSDRISFGTIQYMDSNSNNIKSSYDSLIDGQDDNDISTTGVWSTRRQLSTCSLSSLDFASDYSDVELDDNGNTTTEEENTMKVSFIVSKWSTRFLHMNIMKISSEISPFSIRIS